MQELLFSNLLTGPTAVFLGITAIVAAILGPNHNRTARHFCTLLWVTWSNIVVLTLVGTFLQRGAMGYEGIAWSTGACLDGVMLNSMIRPRLMGRAEG